jgi:hypothetical protein
MKTWKFLSLAFLSAMTTSALVSCQSDDVWQEVIPDEPTTEPTDQEVHTCPLILNVSKEDYPDALQTRSAEEWAANDKIYLTFTVDKTLTCGEATYDGSNWTISFVGSLTADETTQCTAVYIENVESTSNTQVNLNSQSAIYEDENAQYYYSGGSLSVTANLTPKMGRIRFAGTSSAKITVEGITCYTGYDYSTKKYTTASTAISATVASTGYTPYIYGSFTNTTAPRLNLITSTSGFSRSLPTTIYQKGESGYITIPTETSYTNWTNALVFDFNGKDLKLIPVTYSGDNFFLAETEMTKELYQAITGTNTYTTGLQTPIQLTPNSAAEVIKKMRTKTGIYFTLPNSYQWEYAAKGGKLTKGYTYAGSNILSEVGWYADNSNNTVHDVKQMTPNELGFYDMSGNVAEYTASSIDDSYWSSYGGSYTSSASDCTVTSYNSDYYYSSSSDDCGLRVALSH